MATSPSISRCCLRGSTQLYRHPSTLRVVNPIRALSYDAAGATLSQRAQSKSWAVPDFLAPSVHQRSNKASTRCNLASRTTTPQRAFSISANRRAAVLNPRKDEEGNDMVVDITPRASRRLKEIMTSDNNPDLLLRVTVESGGCHGFQYLMSLTDSSAISPEDDTVFAADDGSGARVVMDEPSLELLKGSKVDYTMELIGSQFKIVDNPLATSSCGCGTSFDIKV